MKNLALSLIYLGLLLHLVLSRDFSYYSYDDIVNIFSKLATECPQFIRISTAQEKYNFPSEFTCGTNNQKCFNLIVYMTDYASYTTDRPQFYASGLLHGDEVVGPTTLTELALYFCNPEVKKDWVYDILKQRVFVFTPTTNAYGYSHGIREEAVIRDGKINFVDPNRDFPYFKSNEQYTNQCMQTLAGRTVNELYREFIFVTSLTFHGGTNVIAYPWGNYVHMNRHKATTSPDFSSLHQIGKVMKFYSSSDKNRNNNLPDYDLGDLTATVTLNFYSLDLCYRWGNGGLGICRKLGE